MTRICDCPPSPKGPLFTKHANDCPRRPLAGFDAAVARGEEMRTDPDSFAGGYFYEMGREMAALYGGDAEDYQRRALDELAARLRGNTMGSETTIAAPSNPYRVERGMAADLGWGMAGSPAPRRYDTESGPGLTGADIDALARRHFRDGHAAAERAGEKRIEEMERQLAQAYDEGYTAGRVERAQGLARDVFSRLAGPRVKVIEARHGPKAKMPAAIDAIEESIKEVMEFVGGLFSTRDVHAGERAAAQVARDEA